ncbi:MAG: hypothetical protein AAF696_05335, partial [Bacteroidota bacterium]
MKYVRLKLFLLLFFSCFATLPCYAQCPDFEVGYVGGIRRFCESDSVRIQITGVDTSCIAFYQVDWGNGIDTFTTTGVKARSYDLGMGCTDVQQFFVQVLACEANIGGGFTCDLPIILSVDIIPPPEADFTPSMSTICDGDSVRLSDESCPASAININYTWQGGSHNGPITPYITFPDTGCYPITQTVSSFADGGRQCGVDTRTKSICVVPPPIAEVDFPEDRGTFPDTFITCLDTALFLNASEYSNDGFWIFRRGSNVVVLNNKDSLQVLFNTPGDYSLSYVALSDFCGRDTANYTVRVKSYPNVNLALDTTICNPPPISLNPGAPSYFSYSSPLDYEICWDIGTNPQLCILNPGLQTFNSTVNISVRGQNECGSSTANGRVRILIPDTVQVDSVQGLGALSTDTVSVCNDVGCVQFYASNPNGDWSGQYIDPSGCFNPPTSVFGTTVLLRYGGPCLVGDSIWVRIEGPAPNPVFSLNITDCDTVILNPFDSLQVNPGGPYSYLWEIGGNSFPVLDPGVQVLGQSTDIFLTVEGFCGIAEDTGRIVIAAPEVARIDSIAGFNSLPDTARICNDIACVDLFGSNPGAQWRGPFINPQGCFNPPPTVFDSLVLITYGADCIEPDSIYIYIDGPNPQLQLNLNLTDCDTLSLNPSSYLTLNNGNFDIQWRILGSGLDTTIIGRDPGIFDITDSTRISIEVSNICGVARDTGYVNIFPPGPVQIDPPMGYRQVQDTIFVCQTTGPCQTFLGSPGGYPWLLDGTPTSACIDFSSLSTGMHELSYGGDNCFFINSIFIFVEGVPVNYKVDGNPINPGDSYAICQNGPAFSFTATPDTGMWLGSRIGMDGIYNPALLPIGLNRDTVIYRYEAGDCIYTDSFYLNISLPIADFSVVSCNSLGNQTEICFDLANSSAFDAV